MASNIPQFGAPASSEEPRQHLPPPGMDPQKKNLLMFLAIFTALAVLTGLLLVLTPSNNSGNEQFVDPLAQEEPLDGSGTTTKDGIEAEPEQNGIFALLQRLFAPTRQSNTSGRTSADETATRPGSGMFNVGRTNMFNLGRTTMFSTRTSGSVRTNTSSGQYISTTTLEYRNTSTEAERQAYLRQLEAIEKGIDSAEYRVSELQLIARSSPLRGTISISSVRRSSNGAPEAEYITLTGNKGLPYETPLTGMTLRSLSSGQVVTIGEGVRLPITNELPYKETIHINPGTRVYVVTGKSPLGYSFRINKCTGYFTQFQRFTPAISLRCPRLNTEELPARPNQLSDACLDYINRVPACRIITNFTYTSQDTSYDCNQFIIDHTGYNNCVNLHRQDSDFYQNEWRVYLGRTQTVWKAKREIIWLEDQSGRFIDYYSY